ncbi:MAG TPA: transglycosylase domain-containing protein [Candidatus Saccharimonadales bacterium]|nr:transglycosylase domain-containing protein [Candidatus Saccharimonadales bacterium]
MTKKTNRRPKGMSVYANLALRRKTKADARARKKAEYLATLPKNPLKRFLYRLSPKRLAAFWFSREGMLTALKLLGVGVVIIAIFIAALFAYYRKELDTIRPDEIAKRVQTTITKYYDRNDVLLWEDRGDGDYKQVVKSEEISQVMKDATVALEDKDFLKHPGVSFSGIIRATLNNIFGGGNTQGASTLTQQLVKQVFFEEDAATNRLSISRKIKEVILALEVERMYNKDQILTLYQNESSYGGRRNGVESGARAYFGKSAKELAVAEAALLAAIPQNPTYYNPYRLTPESSEALIARQHLTINNMLEQGYITAQQAEEAKAYPILDNIKPEIAATENAKAPHFVLAVRDALATEFGEKLIGQGGLTIKTTLDYRVQQIAEEAVSKNAGKVRNQGADNTAVTTVDAPTGQILAMVGSLGFDIPGYGQQNAATDSQLEPGSSIKPFIYANLLKERAGTNYGAGSIFADSKEVEKIYCAGAPKPCSLGNFDGGFQGNITMRQALGNSRNPPAVQAMSIGGPNEAIETARAAGDRAYCQGMEQFNLSSAIGGGCNVTVVQHANAYATLARQGIYKEEAYVLEVKNAQGQVIKQWKDDAKRVLDPQITYILSEILADQQARRPALSSLNNAGNGAVINGVKTATKTGTTDKGGTTRQAKDSWMMSYTPRIATGVWVGHHNGDGVNASNAATGGIINEIMGRVHKEIYAKDGSWKEGDWFSRPNGIQTINLGKGNDIFPSWYKKPKETEEKMMFDRVSKKKATACTPERAKTELAVRVIEDPTTKSKTYTAPDGYDANADDNTHKCEDIKPSVTLSTALVGLPPSKTYKITATLTQGTFPLQSVEIVVDGQVISTQPASSPGEYSVEHTFTANGSKSISATVIDAGLYDGAATTTLNVAHSGGNDDKLPLWRRRG